MNTHAALNLRTWLGMVFFVLWSIAISQAPVTGITTLENASNFLRDNVPSVLGSKYAGSIGGDGAFLGVPEGAIRIFDISRNQDLSWEPAPPSGDMFFLVDIDPTGRYVAAATLQEVFVFDVATQDLIQRIRGFYSVSDLAFGPSGTSLAIAAVDRGVDPNRSMVGIWDVRRGQWELRLVPQVDVSGVAGTSNPVAGRFAFDDSGARVAFILGSVDDRHTGTSGQAMVLDRDSQTVSAVPIAQGSLRHRSAVFDSRTGDLFVAYEASRDSSHDVGVAQVQTSDWTQGTELRLQGRGDFVLIGAYGGTVVFSGGGYIGYWDVATGSTFGSGYLGKVVAARISNDEQLVFVVDPPERRATYVVRVPDVRSADQYPHAP